MAKGRLLTKIIFAQAGFTNTCDKVTVTSTTGNANVVISDVGLLWFLSTPASVTVDLQDPSGVWTSVMAAGATVPQLIPSDGLNLRVHSADTSTNRSASYYVIQ